ncbi:unnamed protein product [Linum trigynum]|uniref:Uncharacterized protein n=1 Tax=Linum trigynum TaxID=586398 RepID=A0AAV2GQT2_9ROSI
MPHLWRMEWRFFPDNSCLVGQGSLTISTSLSLSLLCLSPPFVLVMLSCSLLVVASSFRSAWHDPSSLVGVSAAGNSSILATVTHGVV